MVPAGAAAEGVAVVPQEDAEASVAEIERCAGDKASCRSLCRRAPSSRLGGAVIGRSTRPRKRAGLPIGIHIAGSGGHANFGGGWFSFYIEEHFAFAHSVQSVLTSLVFEGVFERFPKLKVILVEGGFAWVPPLMWRLDREWQRMKSEVPHVKRPPSEYVREHFWFTTQPIEEPETNTHLLDTLRWIGADRLMFSTDYPHWDFDDPRFAFKAPLTREEHRMIFRDNAKALFGFN